MKLTFLLLMIYGPLLVAQSTPAESAIKVVRVRGDAVALAGLVKEFRALNVKVIGRYALL